MASNSAVRRAVGPSALKRSRGRSLDGQSFMVSAMVCGLRDVWTAGNDGDRYQRIVTDSGRVSPRQHTRSASDTYVYPRSYSDTRSTNAALEMRP